MNVELLTSVLSVLTSSIPLVIAILAILRNRPYRTTNPNDNASLKILKIKRNPVEKKYWRRYKYGRFGLFILFFIIALAIEFLAFVLLNNSSTIVSITILIFYFAILLISVYLFDHYNHFTYISGITNAYDGRYLIFKNIEIIIESDYYYLFNKCHEVLKIRNFWVQEIDANAGYIEVTNPHIIRSVNVGRIKIALKQVINLRNTYIVSFDGEMIGKSMGQRASTYTTLVKYSKLANRFLNMLISKPNNADSKDQSKIDTSNDVGD